MHTAIQIFTSEVFGEIRTCQVNNQIMFVGKDVATALGYSNTRDALSKHVDAEDKGTVAIRDTAYETRVTLINESGLYSLILSSKLPQAKAFKCTAEPTLLCTFEDGEEESTQKEQPTEHTKNEGSVAGNEERADRPVFLPV